MTFELECGHCLGIRSTFDLCRFCVLPLYREVGDFSQYTLHHCPTAIKQKAVVKRHIVTFEAVQSNSVWPETEADNLGIFSLPCSTIKLHMLVNDGNPIEPSWFQKNSWNNRDWPKIEAKILSQHFKKPRYQLFILLCLLVYGSLYGICYLSVLTWNCESEIPINITETCKMYWNITLCWQITRKLLVHQPDIYYEIIFTAGFTRYNQYKKPISVEFLF